MSIRESMRNSGYVRTRQGKVLAGVCSGLGRKWGVSPWFVRFLCVLSCILPGPQFLAYIAAALLMPRDDA